MPTANAEGPWSIWKAPKDASRRDLSDARPLGVRHRHEPKPGLRIDSAIDTHTAIEHSAATAGLHLAITILALDVYGLWACTRRRNTVNVHRPVGQSLAALKMPNKYKGRNYIGP